MIKLKLILQLELNFPYDKVKNVTKKIQKLFEDALYKLKRLDIISYYTIKLTETGFIYTIDVNNEKYYHI